MAAESCVPRPLFGGAISTTVPARFQCFDSCRTRTTPGRSPTIRRFSLIHPATRASSSSYLTSRARWTTTAARSGSCVVEQSGALELAAFLLGETPAVAATAVGQLAVSKGRQGREAQNIVRIYLANIRLKSAATDVLITAYEPLYINPLSESTVAVAAGPAIPAEQAGCLPMSEIFRLAVMNFNVHDWNLFNGGGH